ncbi:MAG: polysaccharide pyruvyl transferase family protein [Bacteroidota bacterium]
MKIGILTYHFSKNNFGAVLQTYASFQVLKKLNHEPQVINLLPGKKQNIKSKLKHFIKLYLFNNIRFEQFKKTHLHLTEPFYSDENLHKLNSRFDAFYVGSDQVWRASMSKERLIHYFLDFANDEKIKVAYAASFGISKWEGDIEITKQIKPLIKRFNAIGVRENDGVTICKQTFNVDAKQVLDPTLLLDEKDYLKILKKNKKFEGRDYIGYHLIQDREANGPLWKKVKTENTFRVINLFGEKKSVLSKRYLKFNSIENWLYGVKNASLIVTDSFHCVIFSIIFQKNFVCIPNLHGGISRLNNLLNMLELQDRLCTAESLDFNYYISNSVNYSLVNEILIQQVKKSIGFLDNAYNN